MIDLPRQFLIHDRDTRYGATFDRRLRDLGTQQVRTPFRAPWANAISERWVKSVPTEYLDHLLYLQRGPSASIHIRVCHGFQLLASAAATWSTRSANPPLHRFRPAGRTARSRPSPPWVDCITSMGVLHDGWYFCAIQPRRKKLPRIPNALISRTGEGWLAGSSPRGSGSAGERTQATPRR
jgi:hypothetical protein